MVVHAPSSRLATTPPLDHLQAFYNFSKRSPRSMVNTSPSSSDTSSIVRTGTPRVQIPPLTKLESVRVKKCKHCSNSFRVVPSTEELGEFCTKDCQVCHQWYLKQSLEPTGDVPIRQPRQQGDSNPKIAAPIATAPPMPRPQRTHASPNRSTSRLQALISQEAAASIQTMAMSSSDELAVDGIVDTVGTVAFIHEEKHLATDTSNHGSPNALLNLSDIRAPEGMPRRPSGRPHSFQKSLKYLSLDLEIQSRDDAIAATWKDRASIISVSSRKGSPERTPMTTRMHGRAASTHPHSVYELIETIAHQELLADHPHPHQWKPLTAVANAIGEWLFTPKKPSVPQLHLYY